MTFEDEILEKAKEIVGLIVQYDIWNYGHCKYCNNSVSRRDPSFMTYREENCIYGIAKDLEKFIEDHES